MEAIEQNLSLLFLLYYEFYSHTIGFVLKFVINEYIPMILELFNEHFIHNRVIAIIYIFVHIIIGCFIALFTSESGPSFTEKRASLNKIPDFFGIGTFIDSTHMKLYSPSK